MDYAKKIAELKIRREKLEEQLNIKGISEQEKHDINQRIIATTNEITQYVSKLPSQMEQNEAMIFASLHLFFEWLGAMPQLRAFSFFSSFCTSPQLLSHWNTEAASLTPESGLSLPPSSPLSRELHLRFKSSLAPVHSVQSFSSRGIAEKKTQ